MLTLEQQALQARRQSSHCVGLGPSSARCAQQGRPSKPATHVRIDKSSVRTQAATVGANSKAIAFKLAKRGWSRTLLALCHGSKHTAPQVAPPEAEQGTFTDVFLWENQKRLQVQVSDILAALVGRCAQQ